RPGDFESWYAEWRSTAARVHALANEARARGQTVSAREAYLRASNYYRTAEFFLHGNPSDARILDTRGRSRAMFHEAVKLMGAPVEEVLIPYERTALPGYLYRPDDSTDRRPTLIVPGGYDSIAIRPTSTSKVRRVDFGGCEPPQPNKQGPRMSTS